MLPKSAARPARRLSLIVMGAVLALGTLLAACGGGADRTKANLRFVNASAYAALDLRIDGEAVFGGVGYGAGAAYAEVDPAAPDTRVARAGTTTALTSPTLSMTRKKHYSLIGWGREGELKTLLLEDDQTAADAGKARLRVVSVASDAGAVDVYLTAAADTLGGAVAQAAGLDPGEIGTLTTLDAGTWRLRVTGAGDRSDLRLDISGLTLASTGVYTLLIAPSSGGVLVQALLLEQQGTITARAAEHARVRVAAAMPAGGTVAATVGGVALMAETASPAVGGYQLVPAGERTQAVTAGGATLASSTVTLNAGADYTLLVHAAGGAATATWIGEDNTRPASSSQAKVRLVNGLASSSDALSLTASGLPLASGVMPGGYSAGVAVTPAAAADLTVRAAGATTPLYANTDPQLQANGLYTVFVLGGPTPTGLLRADR